MNNTVNKLLLVSIFLLPLLGAYKGFGYEQIKVLFFILSISLIAFLWMFSKPKVKWTSIKIASSLFILILLLTSILGIDPKISFFGGYPYFQGWILYSYLFLFSQLVNQSKIKLEEWANVLVLSSTIVALIAIKDWVLLNLFHIQIPTYAGRVVSTFGQPNFYAGFILLTLPFSYYLASQGETLRSWWIRVGFLVSIVAILISYSKTAISLLVVLFFFWLLYKLSRLKFEIIILSVIVVAASIFVSLKYLTGLPYKELILVQESQWLLENAPEKRMYIWQITPRLVLDKSITGFGLENINKTFSNYFTANKHVLFEENLKVEPALISLKDLNIDRTHNYLLDLALFSGILGTISWILLTILLMKKLVTSKISLENSVILTGFVTYLIWVQFQNQSIVNLVYFWLLVGFIDNDTKDVIK